ncbi:hypothetical protein GW17_00049533 [Ensete ventricosum]|nr:hypothetical protein GW17_00049533 [Ensete ventricosum]
MKIICWNVHGLNKLEKCQELNRRMAIASAIDDSRHGRMAIASVIGDFKHGRAVASSPLGTGRPLGRETVAAALRLGERRHGCEWPNVALCFTYRSSVPERCSPASFFPVAFAGCFTAERPSSAAAGSFTAGGGCSSSAAAGSSPAAAGYFTLGGGCSSLVATGSSPAA